MHNNDDDIVKILTCLIIVHTVYNLCPHDVCQQSHSVLPIVCIDIHDQYNKGLPKVTFDFAVCLHDRRKASVLSEKNILSL